MAVCAEVGVMSDEDAQYLGERASEVFDEVATDNVLFTEPCLLVWVLARLSRDVSEVDVIEATGRILDSEEKDLFKGAKTSLEWGVR